MIGEILVLFMYITRLASNEIFSPSNTLHREVGRAKDLSAPRYVMNFVYIIWMLCVQYCTSCYIFCIFMY